MKKYTKNYNQDSNKITIYSHNRCAHCTGKKLISAKPNDNKETFSADEPVMK